MKGNTVAAAIQLGAATGLRSFMGAAVLAQKLANEPGRPRKRGRIRRVLAEDNVAKALEAGAVLELGGDKLPYAPDRISPVPLLWRAAVGGVLGYAAGERRRRGRAALAAIGAGSAVAAAFAGYAARRFFTTRGTPDWSVALVEDALAIVLASRGTEAAHAGRTWSARAASRELETFGRSALHRASHLRE